MTARKAAISPAPEPPPHEDWQGCPNHIEIANLKEWQTRQNGSLGRMADEMRELRTETALHRAASQTAAASAETACDLARLLGDKVDSMLTRLWWTVMGLAVTVIGSILGLALSGQL